MEEMRQRPESLDKVGERFAVVVRDSGESEEEWAVMLGYSVSRNYNGLALLLKGRSNMPAWRLLIVDALCANHFLTPPERAWAAQATRLTQATYRRQNRTAHPSEALLDQARKVAA